MWYGAKTLYKTTTFGKPSFIDKDFNNELMIIEERVIILQASSFDDAIIIGEKEAYEYASNSDFNTVYGQTTKSEYLNIIDIFELFHDPGNLTEVYSQVTMFDKNHSTDQIIDNRFGNERNESHFKNFDIVKE